MVGRVAGFVEIVDLSLMMMAKGLMGWMDHFMIGPLAWGGGFAVLYRSIPGNTSLVKGILFGIAAWLGMMVPLMALVPHIIFGAVMGTVFHMQAAPKPACR